jgi:hypothetical protein
MGLAALGACVCALLLSATPFDDVANDSQLASNLRAYATAGLLGELSVPADGLSRLEAALLLQQALEGYARLQLSGAGRDASLEQRFSADTAELCDVVTLVGTHVELPTEPLGMATQPAAAEKSAAASALEQQRCADCGEPLDECTAAEPDPCAEPKLEITPYGNVALQLRAGRTAIATGGNLDVSDLTVYWGEIGAGAEAGQLRGHASVLLNSKENSIDLNEAYGEWHAEDGSWALRGGRILQPLGVRDTVFPTYSAASDLVYTTANAVGGEISGGNTKLTAYAFNPRQELAGKNDTLSDYTVSLEFSNSSNDAPDHYRLVAGYTSNAAAADVSPAGAAAALTDRTPAGSLLSEYVWGCGRHRAVIEYSWAFDAFAAADLDANGDGAGDEPRALNVEYIHTDSAAHEYGVRYEQTEQMADYAESRWGVMYGQRLNPFATFRLELSRGEFGDYSTIAADKDTQLNAELRIVF